MAFVLEASPSFAAVWDPNENLDDDGSRLVYLDAGDFARHVVGMHMVGDLSEFPAIFSAIERLHLDGDHYVRELATIGFLEGIQTSAGHAAIDEDVFVPYLEPESRRWWRGLQAFWRGELPSVGPVDE